MHMLYADVFLQEPVVMIVTSSAVAPTLSVSHICSSATVTKIAATALTRHSAVNFFILRGCKIC